MLNEQLALARLNWAFARCTVLGHEEPVLIMHRGDLEMVCPRCGRPE